MTSDSYSSQAQYLTWRSMNGNGASVSLFLPSNPPWPGRVILPRRDTTTSESESLFQKRKSLVKFDARGQVRRRLIPVFWEKWKECASYFLELCKTLHSRIPRRFSPWSWYALSVLDSIGKSDLIGRCLLRSVAPDVQRSLQCTGNSM
jgi:hypothetical protein